MPSIQAGHTIGPYELIAPIGAGGMGEVWRAFDSRLQRHVAIKFNSTAASDRTLREARAVAALSHSNILTLFDVGQHDGALYTVTELLDGETLRQRLQRGAMPWRDAVEVALAVAEGLAASHQRGIVHRDIKPENLFLCRTGPVKILDFGLALDHQAVPLNDQTLEATLPGLVLGTIGYMSPEQARGMAAGPSSDIFALGCVLYECCAGTAPFRRATAAESIAALLHMPPADIDVPRGLNHLLLRCLAKDPLQRLQSASELAALLRESLAGSETRAHSPSATIEAIAVLPFANDAGNPDAGFLCDGVAESILNQLARLPGLRVVPRTLSFPLRGKESDPQELARQLNCRTVLTGRMMVRGDRFQIQVELLDLHTRSQLWGDRFRGAFDDIFEAEERIAGAICERLSVRLSARDQQRLADRGTRNAKAYEHYLRGRAFALEHSPQATAASLKSFEAALAEDPDYPEALAGLAHALVWLSDWRIGDPVDLLQRAKQCAERALALAPEHVESAVVLARVRLSLEADWAGSERLLRDAVSRDPQHSLASQTMSMVLAAAREFDLALAYNRHSIRLDPQAPFLHVALGTNLLVARRCAEGAEYIRARLAERPDQIAYLAVLHWNAAMAGLAEESLQAATRLETLLSGFDFATIFRAFALGAAGRRQEAQALIAEHPIQQNRPNSITALAHAGLVPQALDMLEACARGGFWETFFLHIDPRMDVLRDHPRFQTILDRVGVEKAVEQARRQGWQPLPPPRAL